LSIDGLSFLLVINFSLADNMKEWVSPMAPHVHKEFLSPHGGDPFPLSAEQIRCLLEDELAGTPGAYSEEHIVEINGSLDVTGLQAAALAMMSAAPSLRTHLRLTGGVPRAVLLEDSVVQRRFWGQSSNGPLSLHEALDHLRDALDSRMPDRGSQPHALAQLLTTDTYRHFLMLRVAHGSADWHSKQLIGDKLAGLYRIGKLDASSDRVNYRSYCEAQPKQFLDQRLKEHGERLWREFFSERLVKRSSHSQIVAGIHVLRLGRDTMQRLRLQAVKRSASVSTLLLAAFVLSLRRTFGIGGIAIGLAVSTRGEKYRDTVGSFVNCLPIVVPAGPEDASTLIRSLAAQIAFAKSIAHVPIERLILEGIVGKGVRRFSDILFVGQSPLTNLDLGSARGQWVYPKRRRTGHSLALEVVPLAWGERALNLEYQKDVVGDDTVAYLAESLLNIIDEMTQT
jgi:hypothetical protein